MSFIQKLQAIFPIFRAKPQPDTSLPTQGDAPSLAAADAPPQPRRDRSLKTTKYAVGSTELGCVSGIADYGLFVRLPNGEVGLVYHNETCWPGQEVAYKIGDQVKVFVAGFKADKGVSLSIRKATGQDMFKDFLASARINDRFTGCIKSIKDYGLFITVSPGVEGLLHKDDIPDMSIFERTSIGQPIDVVVINLDQVRMRVQLGLPR